MAATSFKSSIENDPIDEPTQVPLMAKQPVVMLYPTFDVDVAEPEILSPESVVVAKPVAETESADDEALVTTSKIRPIEPPQMVVDAYAVEVPTTREFETEIAVVDANGMIDAVPSPLMVVVAVRPT